MVSRDPTPSVLGWESLRDVPSCADGVLDASHLNLFLDLGIVSLWLSNARPSSRYPPGATRVPKLSPTRSP